MSPLKSQMKHKTIGRGSKASDKLPKRLFSLKLSKEFPGKYRQISNRRRTFRGAMSSHREVLLRSDVWSLRKHVFPLSRLSLRTIALRHSLQITPLSPLREILLRLKKPANCKTEESFRVIVRLREKLVWFYHSIDAQRRGKLENILW